MPPTTFLRDTNAPHDAFLKNDVEIRIAEKAYEVKPNWFTGKKRLFGIILMVLSFVIGRFANKQLPVDELLRYWSDLEANWEAITFLIGGAVTLYGMIDKMLRQKKEVAVVKDVAKELASEVHEKVAEVVEAKTQLTAKKIEVANLKAQQTNERTL